MRALVQHAGLESPQANFLRDFGPALLAKYQPKGILVFSAHWETEGEQLGGLLFSILGVNLYYLLRNTVTDYGEENPLLMDYFNFSPELYQLKFSSRGDAQLSQRVVELFHEVPY
jgi:aromatic ring-opening dioxygenase catalytic subunit (LigB family)